jgi:hypothetical protein
VVPLRPRGGAAAGGEGERAGAGRGLPTLWLLHSYPGCSQHAPDEHILLPVTEEALAIMAGVFWDLGEMKRAF